MKITAARYFGSLVMQLQWLQTIVAIAAELATKFNLAAHYLFLYLCHASLISWQQQRQTQQLILTRLSTLNDNFPTHISDQSTEL